MSDFKPKENQLYYYVSDSLHVGSAYYHQEGFHYDMMEQINRVKSGNCFRREEEAEEVAKQFQLTLKCIKNRNEEQPSEKQLKYAKEIAFTLNISTPVKFTKSAYWKFITDNKSKYDAIMSQRKIDLFADEEDIFWGHEYGLWDY